MAFMAWTGLPSSGVQTFFSWIGYNRDSFNDNVKMRQQQLYQQKNYHLGWVTVARDDIRALMGISVNRINNYMVVATLILSVAAGALLSVSFTDADPDFLVHAFFTSIGTSIIFLIQSIMFGVKGQNCAFTNTMKLLTYEVRPENPADYNHDYMKQVQWIEKRGFLQMFRVPGIMPSYKTQRIGTQTGSLPEKAPTSEDLTPLETLEVKSDHLWYLTKFSNFSRLWLPYDTYSKFVMGLGILALGHSSAYFSLARLMRSQRHLSGFSAIALTSTFVYLVGMVTHQNFKFRYACLRWLVIFLLVVGPILGTFAAMTTSDDVPKVLVPISFFCHSAFYLASFFLAQNDFADAKAAKAKRDVWDYANEQKDEEEGAETATEKAVKAKGGLGLHEKGWMEEEKAKGWEDRSKYQLHGDGRSYDNQKGIPTDGSGGEWPTEFEEFEEKVRKTSDDIRSAVRASLFASFLIWATMTCWSIMTFWLPAPAGDILDQLQLSNENRLAAIATDLQVNWSSPLFRPHALACAEGRIFAADEFHIVEVNSGGTTPQACRVDQTILDIVAICDDKHRQCWPQALVPDDKTGVNKFVDCRSGEESTMLQQSGVVEHVATTVGKTGLEAHRLLASRRDEVGLFEKSSKSSKWEQRWSFGTIGQNGSIKALAGLGGHALFFHKDAIEIRDTDSMANLRTWVMPSNSTQIASGCVVTGTMKALVLTQSALPPHGPRPRLLQVDLPGLSAMVKAPNEKRTKASFMHARSTQRQKHLTMGSAMIQQASETSLSRSVLDVEEEDEDDEL